LTAKAENFSQEKHVISDGDDSIDKSSASEIFVVKTFATINGERKTKANNEFSTLWKTS